jgi:hypothetical protein
MMAVKAIPIFSTVALTGAGVPDLAWDSDAGEGVGGVFRLRAHAYWPSALLRSEGRTEV